MSTFTRLVSVCVLLGVAFFTTGCQTAQAENSKGYGKQKVVYHINYDNPKKQKENAIKVENRVPY